ncbi:hypothetical protein GQ457_13G008350 [Hibiscus cannabinus]
MEDTKRPNGRHSHFKTNPSFVPPHSFHGSLVFLILCPCSVLGSVPFEMSVSLQDGERRILSPCRSQLPIRSVDFLASFASIRPLFHSRKSLLLRGSMVAFRRSSYCGARRENLRPMVHQREEVSIRRCESDEPVIGYREPGGCTSCGEYGVERECHWVLFTRDGALFGAICHALPTSIRHRSASDDVEAGFLLVLRRTERG